MSDQQNGNVNIPALRKNDSRNYLWVESYRPKTIEECILPEELKKAFYGMVESGEVQNMFFYGQSGLGKTTVAKALANELGCDLLTINGSDNRNIDLVRTTIRQFASTASLNSKNKIKIVLIDEADYLNRQSTQPALRAFMEEFSLTTRFIFTANYPSQMMPELISRMVSVDFEIKPDEKRDVMKQLIIRVFGILEAEGVAFNKQVVTQVINKYFPDYRKIINELQRFSVNGELSATIMDSLQDDTYTQLVNLLKGNSFTGCRKWLTENPNQRLEQIVTLLWRDVDTLLSSESIPPFVMLANKYLVSASQTSNATINTLAFLTELMLTVKFL